MSRLQRRQKYQKASDFDNGRIVVYRLSIAKLAFVLIVMYVILDFLLKGMYTRLLKLCYGGLLPIVSDHPDPLFKAI